MKYLNALLVLVLCVAMAACDDEMKFMAEGDPMQISVNATTKYSGAQSRAVLGKEVEITGYTFLYYVKKNGNLTLSNKTYSTESGFSVAIECPGTEPNLAILIANAPKDAFDNLALGSNISELNNYAQDWTHTYNNLPSAEDFTWSGYQSVTQDTRTLDFTLNPNVAKIILTIYDNSDESEVEDLRVKNVPKKVRYAQNALSKSKLYVEDNAAATSLGVMDYDMEDLKELKELNMMTKNDDGSYSYSWYVPHNERGTGVRFSDIPENATYVEIDGKRNDDDWTTAYRIYPGVSEENKLYSELENFNILADYIYNISVNINDDGLTYDGTNGYVADKPEQSTLKIKLPSLSNCYMIHPKYSDSVNPAVPVGTIHNTTVYELPIYERVNEYWGTDWGITDLGNNSNNVIDYDTEWVMEVIWQDINARAIYFCDEYGNGELDTYSGIGKNPVYFKLDRNTLNATKNRTHATSTKQDIYGNILVGVKKVIAGVAQDGYLWSWHLWLTDYTPDEAPVYTAGSKLLYVLTEKQQGYTSYDNSGTIVNDDNVQHFYDTSTFWTGSTSPNVWNSGGIYANKWIMDRNIGAQSPSNMRAKDPVEAFGMYYQYGRKDPFPFHGAQFQHTSYSDYNLYKIDGSTEVSWSVGSTTAGASYNVATGNPTKTYAYPNESKYTWTTTPNANPWFNPKAVSSKKEKLLFDPCPPGWTLPYQDAFEFADRTNSTGTTKGTVYVYSSNTAGATLGDLRCNTLISMASTVAPKSLYISLPATGFISPTAASLSVPLLTDARGYMWFADGYLNDYQRTGLGFGYASGQNASAGSDNTTNNFIFKIYSRPVYMETLSTARGQNVRCIQVPE